jgi:hypothetical protein
VTRDFRDAPVCRYDRNAVQLWHGRDRFQYVLEHGKRQIFPQPRRKRVSQTLLRKRGVLNRNDGPDFGMRHSPIIPH